MRDWILKASVVAVAVVLAACSKSEEQTPVAPTPVPTQKKESAKPTAAVPTPTPSTAPAPAQLGTPPAAPSVAPVESPAALENGYKSNPEFSARVETIYKLSDAGTPEAIATLGRLFHVETDPELKTEILDSLFDIDGQDEAKVALLAAGAGADQPKEVRQSAIDGLEDIKPGLAIPILKALVSDPDAEISEAAKDSLESVQDQQANPPPPN